MSTHRPTLRERLRQSRGLVALGAHDGLTATIAERSGVEALYIGGYAMAAHDLGLPDIGLLGLPELSAGVRRVRGASSLPILADADTGFGSEPGVVRTVEELQRAGASAVQIEDQVFPKRCGHLDGKRVIPAEEMARKVRAAVAARNPETMIVARTDSLQVNGLKDAIERCNLYAEAGADLVFVDAPSTREQLIEIPRHVRAPLLANMSETGRTPFHTAPQLYEMGYAVVIYPSSQTYLFAHAYAKLCAAVTTSGTTEPLRDSMMPFDEVNELLGLERWERRPGPLGR